MNSALEDAIKEAYACAPSNDVIIETLEISHPSVGGSLYLVSQREEIMAKLETSETVTFEPTGFKFTLPAAGENGRQDLELSIDNVDRRISEFINLAKDYPGQPVTVVYRPYLSSDLSAPQMSPPLTLTLRDISITVFQVSGRATFADLINLKFPSDYYTRKRFPGLGG